jgi:NADH-quinone oxidoreductase subunit L
VIGAITLLLAGAAALAQDDIKRVLAYSTISQLGYMFLALGVGAWSAAIFHLMTHACFKSLLFLAAGVVILALDHEHDIHRMGGLLRRLPVTSWCFVAAAAALAGLPLLTSGFYSKGAILAAAWQRSPLLWLAGIVGALLTAGYIFRVVLVAFVGAAPPGDGAPIRRPSALMLGPLVVLAVLSLTVGFLETPEFLGGVRAVSRVLDGALPVHGAHLPLHTELLLELAATVASVGGAVLAWWLLCRRRDLLQRLVDRPAPAALRALAASGWGFDTLYQKLLVGPFVALAERNRDDLVDRVATLPADLASALHRALSLTQDGRIRRSVTWLAIGAAIALAVVVLT